MGNDTTGTNTHSALQTPTQLQSELWSKYDDGGGGLPFGDIGNRVIFDRYGYSPQVLQGLIQSQVAADLTDPSSPVTQAIVGSANYMTAAVCAATGQQPSSVCSVGAVVQASKALKLT